jgi:hypothetical protein
LNHDTDGDGTWDGAEVAHGGNPNNPGDGGNPPADPVEEVEFTVGGDYATWRMEIKATGPRDNRTLNLTSPQPGQNETQSFKLWKNNRYEITLHRTGGVEDWYCWEAAVDAKPTAATFNAASGYYQLGGRNDQSHFFTVADHWLVDNRQGLLTRHLHSHQNDIASPLKAVLMPVAIEDNIEATGVDIVSNSVAPGVAGYQDKLWIMAPSGNDPSGNPCSNAMKFKIPANPPVELEMTYPQGAQPPATPTPGTVTLGAAAAECAWHGESPITTETPAVVWKIGEHQDEVDLPIAVKTMKRRTVKVLVHYVTGAERNPATGEFINLRPPVTQITPQQIKDKLYEIYSRQINIWFTNLETVNHTIDWDIGVTSDWGTSQHPISGNNVESFNRIFDMGWNADDNIGNLIARPEELKLRNLINPQSDANIHVFIIGGCWGIQKHVGLINGLFSDNEILDGYNDRNRRIVYVPSQLIGSGAIPQEEILTIIAHEIGHILVGVGHPDQNDGVAPLPGTTHVNRLMFSDINLKATANALDKNLLVKAEWDAAEEWLSLRPNGDN